MGSLPVFFVHVEAGAVHGRDDFVEGDFSSGVEEAGEVHRSDRAHGCDGVALDAGDLHQAVHGVAGEAEIVFHCDLGGVFDLIYEKFLGDLLTAEEQAQLKAIDDALLWYDLTTLLGEPLRGEAPKLQVMPDYIVRPFAEVEREYLEMFREYSR